MMTAANLPEVPVRKDVGGRFYIGMALAAIATSIAGFGPALIDPASRTSPLTVALGLHGVIFGAWLLLFLAQACLVTYARVHMHRQLGYAGGALAMIMLVSGYFTTIAMARRGFDLSGDLMREPGNPHMLMVFQLGDLLCFGVLVLAAILSRGRPDIHKRLMLLATIGGLMPAALTHIIGHSRILREMDPAIVLIPFFTFLFAGTINDRLSQGKIHAVSFWGALGVFLWANVRAIVIGPSTAWQDFAGWLIR